jgi:hypothetical protein
MPLEKSASKAALDRNIHELSQSGKYPHKQVIAIALNTQDRARRASGGSVNPPVREISTPTLRNDLIVEPTDSREDTLIAEGHARERFANKLNYADPFIGNGRTFDPDGRYNCGRCNQADGNKCLFVQINNLNLEAGSCRLWEDICAGDPEVRLQVVDVDQASYGVAANGVGFGCHRCPFSSKSKRGPDNQGRSLWCGKGGFRVFPNACCEINGAPVVPQRQHHAAGGSTGSRDRRAIGGGLAPHLPNIGATMGHMGMPKIAAPMHNLPRPMAGGLGRDMPRLAAGGVESPQQAMPWFVRSDARQLGGDAFHPGGLINSTVAGRSDRIPLAVAADSHVIPADVVAGIGQGNTMAGADMLQQMFQTGPYGTPLPRGGRGAGPPRPPRPAATAGYAKGGRSHTPILAAGGEFIVPPDAVERLGGGNMKRGHDAIDKMIDSVRKMVIEFTRNAPKPKK